MDSIEINPIFVIIKTKPMKTIISILVSLLIVSCSKQEVNKVESPKQEKVIEVSLVDIFNAYSGDDVFAANCKYAGRVIEITGRTSGVDEDGWLLLQTKSCSEAIPCISIQDKDFLLSIKKNDNVTIRGTVAMRRVPIVGEFPVLTNCTYWRKN